MIDDLVIQADIRADASPKPTISEGGSCYRCGGHHKFHECRFREALCHICHMLKQMLSMMEQR